MNFVDIVNQVILYTNRPDLGFENVGGDGQIPQLVLSAAMNIHSLDFFWRDIVESDVLFPTTAYLQNLDTSILPRYRSLAYFRKWDLQEGMMDDAQNIATSYGAFGNYYPPVNYPPSSSPLPIDPITGVSVSYENQYKMLDIVDTRSMFDDYGLVRSDICYSAGNTLRIKSTTLLSMGKIGYYQYPSNDISNNGANWIDWIADSYPFAIIWQAVAMVLVVMGDTDGAKAILRPANPRTGDPGGVAAQAITALVAGNIEASAR
jgi:hypothetical protein